VASWWLLNPTYSKSVVVYIWTVHMERSGVGELSKKTA